VVVLTNHANLQYYRHLQKINQQVARYISFLKDFNYQLKHIPGIHNHADALSRRLDHNNGTDNNEQVMALPNNIFIRVILMTILDESFRKQQHQEHSQLEAWWSRHGLEWKNDNYCYKGSALVAIGGEEDKQALLQIYHDSLTVGHPGAARSLKSLAQDYWWLGVGHFIQPYVRGCPKCQESKVQMHPNTPPLQPIMPNPHSQLFAIITMDFIVKLLVSHGYDSILTITNYDCTKAVILLPC